MDKALNVLLIVVVAIGLVLRAMSGKRFPRNYIGKRLSQEEQRALNVGAIMAGVRTDMCNSLKTGKKVGAITKTLNEWWEINSSQTAVEALDSLKYEGRHVDYDYILKNAADAFASEPFGDYDSEALSNLKQALPELQARHFLAASSDSAGSPQGIVDFSELSSISVAAWDMGRMVNVSRWCYEAGYISEAQAWEYIFFAREESAALYADWSEFGKAYVLGRAMWGDHAMLNDFMDMVETLLKNKRSPWLSVPLR